MAKWLLDAGHGGSDPGACYKGRRESDDVLRLVQAIGAILVSNGETVGYTRTSDAALSLSARTNKCNAEGYNYLVSVHRNAFSPEQAMGAETYVYLGYSSKPDGALATAVNNALVSLGYFNRKVKEGNLHMVRESKCTAILTEVGFIDNTGDNNLFDSKFNLIALGIANGCLSQVGKNAGSGSGATTPPPTNNKELYRVRKSWADAASQLGAYSNLDSAKALCDQNSGYSVYNQAGTKVHPVEVVTPPPTSNTGKYLNLKPHMAKWAVYNQNGPYTSAHKIGEVLPAKFGGLSYKVLSEKGNDVYIIETGSFGKCAIWVPVDNDSTITNTAAYGNTSAPAPTKQYINLKPHNATWSVYNQNGPYTSAYAIGKLAPAQFGGISYEILASKGNDVYIIQTGSFGRVAIWVPKDNDSSFTTSPVY